MLIDDGGLGLGLETFAAAQDALIRIGSNAQSGSLVTSATNNFDDAITGLDIELLAPGTTPGEVVVEKDTEVVTTAVESFVDNYNELIDAVRELTKFDPETNERGVLQGQGIVLRIQSRLQSLMSRSIFGSERSVRSLLDLGIRADQDGKLKIDSQKLDDAIQQNPQQVADFFLEERDETVAASKDGFSAVLESTIESFTDTFTGSLTFQKDALQDSVDSLGLRIEQLNGILAVRRQRLLEQFINMEEALGALSAQQAAIGAISPLNINPIRTRVA